MNERLAEAPMVKTISKARTYVIAERITRERHRLKFLTIIDRMRTRLVAGKVKSK